METVLAEASGVALRQRGQQLLFVDLGTNWVYTTAFVLGLLTFILGVNGIVQLGLAIAGEGILLLGVALTIAASLFGFALYKLVRRVPTQRQKPSEALKVLLILDAQSRQVLASDGTALASFDQIRFVKRFQFGSSSPALAIEWPHGTRVLVRGNVFAGGIQAFLDVLSQQGFSA